MPTKLPERETTRRLIGKLFASQMDCARKLKFAERTVRWWCEKGAPPHVIKVLRMLVRGEISLRHAARVLRQRRERRRYS